MNSSDGTLDNLPQNSPLSFLPPKAAPCRRTAAVRPKKPPAPKQLVVKVMAPSVTKRRSATTAQPRKILPKDKPLLEKLPKVSNERAPSSNAKTPNPYAKPLNSGVLLRLPHQAKRKSVPEPQESTDSDWDQEPSSSDQAIQTATEQLEGLLETTTMMVNELRKEKQDVQRLQQEKLKLLDELLVFEGLAVNPYPPFKPAILARKPKRVRR